MTKTDRFAKAKDYIAIAEASDSEEAAWRQAAAEIEAVMKSHGLSQRAAAEELGRARSWLQTVLKWAMDRDPGHPPFGGEAQNNARYDRHVKRVLRDPERRKQAIASLSHDERAELVNEVAKAPAPEPNESRRALRDHMQDAVAVDLSAQVAKLIAGASRIDLLLAERGAEFRRINAEQAERFDADLERVMNTIRDVRGELLKHREIEVSS